MLLPAPAIVVSANARFLTKMGRVYIYSKQRISKGIFDDDEFRAMCHAFYEAGGEQGHGALSEETCSL